MATVEDAILTPAFRKAEISSPTATQLASALVSLNNLLSGFGGHRMTPAPIRENFDLTAGTREYTIGSGGNFDTVRPIKIENAFLRDSDSYDWPLEIVDAKKINDVAYKANEARPSRLYYIPTISLAYIVFDCEPDAVYTLYMHSMKNFTEFAATSTTVTLANEYKLFLVSNLAIDLANEWGRNISETMYRQALETRDMVQQMIASTRMPAESKLDMMVGRNYNIVTDC